MPPGSRSNRASRGRAAQTGAVEQDAPKARNPMIGKPDPDECPASCTARDHGHCWACGARTSHPSPPYGLCPACLRHESQPYD